MKVWIAIRLTALCTVAMVALDNRAWAQAHDHSHAAHGSHTHSAEILAFHLPQWKVMHFEDQQKAAQHAAAVQKMGCEVQQGQHAGHIDVSYRCPQWRTMQVANHQLAEQWSAWLAASGFDVSHSHSDPAFATGPEVVEFRLQSWKVLHGSGSAQEAQLVEQLKQVGCEVAVEAHQGHADIRFRAPSWRDIHVADHATAEQWIAWFRQNGFEVRHEH
ncbi:MAG: hypothetical protein KDA45_16670 [Planctomycetales bacterium]|nr:hypothetical protein [Planctomycetales bacterium]